MEEDPELVRDAGANFRCTKFEPNERNVTVTTHWIEEGLLSYTGEKWLRKQRIGGGGQGDVYLECLQDDESKERAVKRIKIADEDVKRRHYIRELETLMKFSQDGFRRWFIHAHGWYETEQYLYIPMEYFPLGDLDKYLRKHGPLPEKEVKAITWQIAHALQIMHKEQFAHRDIKAANILIDRQGEGKWRVKVADMGISKRIGELDGSTTTVRFTRDYRAPELVFLTEETEMDARATDPNPVDMWCLGETVFYMLTKKHTFSGPKRDIDCVKYYRGREPFPVKHLVQNGVSSETIELVKMLMQPRPQDRLSPLAAKTWLEGGVDALRKKIDDEPQLFSRPGAKFDHAKLFQVIEEASQEPGKEVPMVSSKASESPNESLFDSQKNLPSQRVPEEASQEPEEEATGWTKTEVPQNRSQPPEDGNLELSHHPNTGKPSPEEPSSPRYQATEPPESPPTSSDDDDYDDCQPPQPESDFRPWYSDRESIQPNAHSGFSRSPATGPFHREQTRPLARYEHPKHALMRVENSNGSDQEGSSNLPQRDTHTEDSAGFYLSNDKGQSIWTLNTDPRVQRLTSAGWSVADAQYGLQQTQGRTFEAELVLKGGTSQLGPAHKNQTRSVDYSQSLRKPQSDSNLPSGTLAATTSAHLDSPEHQELSFRTHHVLNDSEVRDLVSDHGTSVERAQEALRLASGDLKKAGQLVERWEMKDPQADDLPHSRPASTNPQLGRHGSHSQRLAPRPPPKVIVNDGIHPAGHDDTIQVEVHDRRNHGHAYDDPNSERVEYKTLLVDRTTDKYRRRSDPSEYVGQHGTSSHSRAPSDPPPYHPGPPSPPLPPRKHAHHDDNYQGGSPMVYQQTARRREDGSAFATPVFAPVSNSPPQKGKRDDRVYIDYQPEKPKRPAPNLQSYQPGIRQTLRNVLSPGGGTWVIGETIKQRTHQ